METKEWLICGYSSLEKILELRFPVGSYSESKVRQLLQTLTARYGSLTAEEIMGAYARRRTRLSNSLLEVQRNGKFPEFSCGTNPYFIAKVVGKVG